MRYFLTLFLAVLSCSASPLGFGNSPLYGCVGRWVMNEGTGTTTSDISGKWGVAGTFTNSPSWTNGIVGKAIYFNGTNQFVQLPSTTVLDGGFITMSAWVRVITNGNGVVLPRIIDRGSGAGGQFILYLNTSGGNNTIGAGIQTTGTSYLSESLSTNGSFVLSNWQHICVTYDGASTIAYRDGLPRGTNTTASGVMATSTLAPRIGQRADSGGDRSFAGTIDDVQLYNRALTAGEVKKLYNGGASTH